MENKASTIWQEYLDGISYQKRMGFSEDFPKIIDFKEGKQWAKATANTRNLPRPVFNITEMFIRSKRAAITNQELVMDFSPLETFSDESLQQHAEQGAEDYNNFSKITWENIDQDELNNEFVDDAVTLGTGILHYTFNPNVSGGNMVKWLGDLEGEVLDALNVFFANPQCRNVQKQEWIIVQSRITIKEAKKLAKDNNISEELITADNNQSGEYDSEKNKLKDNDEITILTKYFRKDGEVYYSKSTQSVVIIDDRPLTPEPPESEDQGQNKGFKMTLYPVVALNCLRRKKCIFGIGIAQDVITINKIYNQLKAMQTLNGIQCGNPALLVKPNALKQPITNQGGQIIVDHYPNGDGIKYLQPPAFSNIFSQICNEIFEMARTTTGVTDVSTGETLGANMAAAAIIALQNQAKTPIKELQERYFSAIKEVGDIWLQFYKAYYTLGRNMTVENEEGKAESRVFTGSDYADVDYKIKVEVGVASDRETLAVSLLDAMMQRGDITKQQYVELMPDAAMPFKSEITEMWEKEKQDQLVQALMQLKQSQEIIAELQGQLQEKDQGGERTKKALVNAMNQLKQQGQLLKGGADNEM